MRLWFTLLILASGTVGAESSQWPAGVAVNFADRMQLEPLLEFLATNPRPSSQRDLGPWLEDVAPRIPSPLPSLQLDHRARAFAWITKEGRVEPTQPQTLALTFQRFLIKDWPLNSQSAWRLKPILFHQVAALLALPFDYALWDDREAAVAALLSIQPEDLGAPVRLYGPKSLEALHVLVLHRLLNEPQVMSSPRVWRSVAAMATERNFALRRRAALDVMRTQPAYFSREAWDEANASCEDLLEYLPPVKRSAQAVH